MTKAIEKIEQDVEQYTEELANDAVLDERSKPQKGDKRLNANSVLKHIEAKQKFELEKEKLAADNAIANSELALKRDQLELEKLKLELEQDRENARLELEKIKAEYAHAENVAKIKADERSAAAGAKAQMRVAITGSIGKCLVSLAAIASTMMVVKENDTRVFSKQAGEAVNRICNCLKF